MKKIVYLLLALFLSSGFLAACKGAVWFEGYTPQEPQEIQLNMQHIESPIVNASAPTCHLFLNETGPDSANLTINVGTVALFYQNGNFSTWFSVDSKEPEELASILKTEPSAAGEFYSRQYNITLNGLSNGAHLITIRVAGQYYGPEVSYYDCEGNGTVLVNDQITVSPNVPEFPALAIVTSLLLVFSIAVTVTHRKTKSSLSQ
jgi:hypothetical protein